MLNNVVMDVMRQLVRAVHEVARASRSRKITAAHVMTAIRQLFPRSGVVMSEQCMTILAQRSARRAADAACVHEQHTPTHLSTV